MRTFTPLSLIAVIFVLGLSASNSPAVPTPADKPVKWEYGELIQRSARGGFVGKGGDPADGVQPVQPVQPALPTIRWVTADDEISGKNWEELAEKLKADKPRKDATAANHKLRVFDRLGAEGWELVGTQASSPTAATGTWIFKRRVP